MYSRLSTNARVLALGICALTVPAIEATPAHAAESHAAPIPRLAASSGAGADSDARDVLLLSRAQSLRDERRLLEALVLYQRMLARATSRNGVDDGTYQRAYRLHTLTLADLGNSQLAQELMRARPALFAEHERERIEGDRVARGIVWGATRQPDPTRPNAAGQQALQALRDLQRNNPRATRWETTRLSVDALSALNQLGRHQEVVDGYEALQADGTEIPAYILPTVGDSLLALRRPADAATVLEAARTYDPANTNVQVLLGYAWLEQERFDLALPHFEALAASQPAWPRRAGAKSGYENWDRYSADLNLALAHGFANDTARAERELQALADVGPYNAGLQSTLGSVQALRQRPSAALERHRMALTMDPDLREARAGEVDAQLALARPDLASQGFNALRAIHPDDPRLDRLDTTLDRYRGWQLRLEAGRGRSEPRDSGASASASPFGSRDGGYRAQLESPLIADRWRVGVLARDEWADFEPAGLERERVRHRSLGAGVSYRYDRLGASAYVTRANDAYDDGAAGLELRADWRFSDAWRGRVAYLRNDPDASLQARRFGITADSASVGAAWTPSDYTRLDLRAAQFRYEDGNRRDLVGADLSQRIASRPHLIVDALASASASRGSLGERTAYFNPSRDASVLAGVRAEHITWRRYEVGFRQRFELSAGPYWQDGFGSHWVPSAAYRHAWDLGTGSRLEYGVSWSRPVYDGNREQRIGLDVTYRWGTAP